MLNRLYCGHCGDVIGIYEPLVVVTTDGLRETSLAAEPWLLDDLAVAAGAGCFHGECAGSAREWLVRGDTGAGAALHGWPPTESAPEWTPPH